LDHGSGGKLSADLIHDVLLAAFDNPILARMDDQAIFDINGLRNSRRKRRLALKSTTGRSWCAKR
jgi:hydrogenase maturation factor